MGLFKPLRRLGVGYAQIGEDDQIAFDASAAKIKETGTEAPVPMVDVLDNIRKKIRAEGYVNAADPDYGLARNGLDDDGDKFQALVDLKRCVYVPPGGAIKIGGDKIIQMNTPGQVLFGPSIFSSVEAQTVGANPSTFVSGGFFREASDGSPMFRVNWSQCMFAGLSFHGVNYTTNQECVRAEKLSNTDDIDFWFFDNQVLHFQRALNVVGRALTAMRNTFALCEVPITLDWPTSGTAYTSAEQGPPFGNRACRIQHNRFHSNRQGIRAIGSVPLRGAQITDNVVDVGERLIEVTCGLDKCRITRNTADMCNKAPIFISGPVTQSDLSGNHLGGMEGHDDQSPSSAILLQDNGVITDLTIDNLQVWNTRSSAIIIGGTDLVGNPTIVSGLSVCGGTFTRIGTDGASTRAILATAFNLDGLKFTGNTARTSPPPWGIFFTSAALTLSNSLVGPNLFHGASGLLSPHVDAGGNFKNLKPSAYSISANGNFGIGTFAPVRRLHVRDFDPIALRLERAQSVAGVGIEIENDAGLFALYGTPAGASKGSVSPGAYSISLGERLYPWTSLFLGPNGNYIGFAGAPPTTGTWKRGDIVWSTLAAPGGPDGWKCVADGTPGSWTTTGAFDPAVAAGVIPPVDLKFVPGFTSPQLAVGRASPGSYTGATGLLRTAASGVLRITTDPLSRKNLGALIEGSEANPIATPTNLTGAQFADAEATDGQAAGPFGTLTLAKLVSTIDGGAATCNSADQITVPNDALRRTFGPYLRQGTSPTTLVSLAYADGATPIGVKALLTWATKSLTVDAGTSGGTGRLIDRGGGLYRVEMTLANNASGNTRLIGRVHVRDDGAANVLGEYVYAGDRQFGVGAALTSYTLVNGSAAPRAADILSIALDATMAGAKENTVYIAGRAPAAIETGKTVILFDLYASSQERLVARINASRQVQVLLIAGGVTIASRTLGTVEFGGEFRLAAGYGNGQFSCALNGAPPSTGAVASLPAQPTQARIGSDHNGNGLLNGSVQRFFLYPHFGGDDTLLRMAA